MFRLNKGKIRAKSTRMRQGRMSSASTDMISNLRSKKVKYRFNLEGLIKNKKRKNNFVRMGKRASVARKSKKMSLLQYISQDDSSNLKGKILQRLFKDKEEVTVKEKSVEDKGGASHTSFSKNFSMDYENSTARLELEKLIRLRKEGRTDPINIYFYEKIEDMLKIEDKWFFSEAKQKYKKLYELVTSVRYMEKAESVCPPDQIFTPFRCDELLTSCDDMLDFTYEPSAKLKTRKLELLLMQFCDVFKDTCVRLKSHNLSYVSNSITLIIGYFIRMLDKIFSLKKIEVFDEYTKQVEELKSQITKVEIERNIALKEKMEVEELLKERNEYTRIDREDLLSQINSLRVENANLRIANKESKRRPTEIVYQCEKIESNLETLGKNLEECMKDNRAQTLMVSNRFSQLLRVAKKQNFFSDNKGTQTLETSVIPLKIQYFCRKEVGREKEQIQDPSMFFYNDFNMLSYPLPKGEEVKKIASSLKSDIPLVMHCFLMQRETHDFMSYLFCSLLNKFDHREARIRITCLKEKTLKIFKKKNKKLKKGETYLELFGMLTGLNGYQKPEMEELNIIRNSYKSLVAIVEPKRGNSNDVFNAFFTNRNVTMLQQVVAKCKNYLKKKIPFNSVFDDIDKRLQRESFFFSRLVRYFLTKILIKKMISSKAVDFNLDKLPMIFKAEDSTITSKKKFLKFLGNLIANYETISARIKSGEEVLSSSKDNVDPLHASKFSLLSLDSCYKIGFSSRRSNQESEEPRNDNPRILKAFSGVDFAKHKNYILEKMFDKDQIGALDLQIFINSQIGEFFFFYSFLYDLISPMVKKGKIEDNIELEISEVIVQICKALNLQDTKFWLSNEKNLIKNLTKIEFESLSSAVKFFKHERDKETLMTRLATSIIRNDTNEVFRRTRGERLKIPTEAAQRVLLEYKEIIRIKYQARNPGVITMIEKKIERTPRTLKKSKNSNRPLLRTSKPGSERRGGQISSMTNFKESKISLN